MHSNSVFFGIFALATPAIAFFRLPCSQPIVTERADPIVDPGVVSGHVHTIMGGNGFGFDMTYADTQSSTCSSCAITKDLSNYWVPTLYYKGQDGTFQSVQQDGGALIYYLQRSSTDDPLASEGLLAFPEGFRMTAGNPTLRNYTGSLEQQAISYACLGTETEETNGFPNYNCPDNLRAQVFFPSCWNGVDLDSPDHQSHMAYPSVYNAGQCPESHPHRFVSIFYEVQWETNVFADMWYGDEQPFVWSFGDPTGFGYHGDFINGWDVPTLQNAVTNCNDDSGVIQDCQVFDNLFFTTDQNNGCLIPPMIDEQVAGNLTSLPGCNPIQAGPELAIEESGCGAVDVIGTPENLFVDLTQSMGFKYLGCGTDIAYGADRTLASTSITLSNLTVASCAQYCEGLGFSIAGMEYSNQCYCSDSMTSGRAPVPGLMGACTMPCAGDASENCGGAAWIGLYEKCISGEDCDNISYIINSKIGPQPAGISTVTGIATGTVGAILSAATVTGAVSSAAGAVEATGSVAVVSDIEATGTPIFSVGTVVADAETPSAVPTSASEVVTDGGATTVHTETIPTGTTTLTVFLTSTTHVGASPTTTLLDFPTSDGEKAVGTVTSEFNVGSASGSAACDADGNGPTVTVTATVALSTITIQVPASTASGVDAEVSGSAVSAVSDSAPIAVSTVTVAPFPFPSANSTIATSGTIGTGANTASSFLPTGTLGIRHAGHMRRHVQGY